MVGLESLLLFNLQIHFCPEVNWRTEVQSPELST